MENAMKTKQGERSNMLKICAAAAGILILAFAFASCASAGRGEKPDVHSLQERVELFNSAMRWGDYPAASAMVVPPKKEQFWSLTELLKKTARITDTIVREATVSKLGTTGTAIVTVQYYRLNAPVIKEVVIREDWVFSKEDKAWKIADVESKELEDIK